MQNRIWNECFCPGECSVNIIFIDENIRVDRCVYIECSKFKVFSVSYCK